MKKNLWSSIIRNKYFRFLASIKFAIPILILFALGMIVGTIAESKYGTLYAAKAIYHSWWFYLIQACIAISLLFAMLVRLPFQKRLCGFYLVHVSLLIIMFGSVITRYFGVDGVIELEKNQPNSQIHLADSVVYISKDNKVRTVELPAAIKPQNLSKTISLDSGAKIAFDQYLPYAQPFEEWKTKPGAWITRWMIKNSNIQQEFEIANELAGQVESKVNLGPLQLLVLEEKLTQELAKVLSGAHRGFILFNIKNSRYYPIINPIEGLALKDDGKAISIRMPEAAKNEMPFFEFKVDEDNFIFFPQYSTRPLVGHLKTDDNSVYRLLNVSELAIKNTVYISMLASGDLRLVMGQDKTWKTQILDSQNSELKLPWMEFKLSLSEKIIGKSKEIRFVESTPQKEDEKNLSAIRVTIESKGKSETIWLNNKEVTRSSLADSDLYIGPEPIKLPMTLILENFNMEMIPGTDRPASYESLVKVMDNRLGFPQETVAKIFMNNPYKADGYTFYQSSYFQDNKGEYHSVLSVNRDPGRIIKYVGALSLVFALILHFMIIYGKIRL